MRLLRVLAAGALLSVSFTGLSAQESSLSAPVRVLPVAGLSRDAIRGVDVSTLAELEALGSTFSDGAGIKKDLFIILKENGVNWVRFRLWNNPVNAEDVLSGDKLVSKKGDPVGAGSNDLARTVALGKRAKAAGLKFLLDIHYSDFWADPSKQVKPEAWKDLSGDALRKAVYTYTDTVMKTLIAGGARPDMVQVGNELNGGFLWPDGKTWKEKPSDTIGGYDGFIALLKQGIKAVRDNEGSGGKIRVAIHLADGADNALYRRVFDPITAANVDFDIIGLSFYPYWHGAPSDLAKNLKDLASRYKKDLVIMETAYAFTLDNGDDYGNIFTSGLEKNGGYAVGPQGQATLLRDLFEVMAQVNGGKGLGLFYWEPAWLPKKGSGWRTGEGNAWENQALFDFSGRALPSLSVFNKIYDGEKDFKAQPVSVNPVAVKAVLGEGVALPKTVTATFSDASFREVAVKWESFDSKKMKSAGTVEVKGSVEGSSLAVKATLTFTAIKNLVEDNSFESGKCDFWTVGDPQGASLVEKNPGNAHSGDFSFKYWLDNPFQVMLSRTFKDIPNGNYTFSIWAMGGGGEKAVKLFARDFGAKTLSTAITNTGWQKWKQYTISGIKVSSGTCTVGLFIDGMNGNWANYDDVEFYLEKE